MLSEWLQIVGCIGGAMLVVEIWCQRGTATVKETLCAVEMLAWLCGYEEPGRASFVDLCDRVGADPADVYARFNESMEGRYPRFKLLRLVTEAVEIAAD